ncbi:MAG: hypothetical protein HQK62_06265 [Desulfamplus sp.]|nr:hypothetical protein [Desulfamplus sp.]
MKTALTLSIGLLLITLCVAHAFGDDITSMKKPGRHHNPPPEAYTACEGKSAGDSAEFVNPHGETVTGICELQETRLVLRPERPPRDDSDTTKMDNNINN